MRNSRLLSILLVLSLITLVLPFTTTPFLPITSVTNQQTINANYVSPTITPPLAPRTVRVAIYNEPNTTFPNYITHSPDIQNSSAELATILTATGFTVTILDLHDIYNHALMTANFDVLVLPDTLPRENITNQVLEFWLGGGGILALDSAGSYLCYFGILPPESAGSDGRLTWWSYLANEGNVSLRHPVSKAYQVNDTFSTPSLVYHTWYWNQLQTSVIFPDLVKIAERPGTPNQVTVLGFDPTDRGGRVVHMWWDGKTDPLPGIHQMIRDAANWLCPRPKGRLLYDLSHIPYYGVDGWDDLAQYTTQLHNEWRNALVNRSYTFDKFYPTLTGNLTLNVLNQYDVLIICSPAYNFTAAEVTAFTSWINNGGSLIAVGDAPGFIEELNYLMSNLNLSFNETTSGGTGDLTKLNDHPVAEGATLLNVLGAGRVVLSGSAIPLWGFATDNVQVAVDKQGSGRIVAIADLAILRDNRIGLNDHYEFGVNIVNWASSSTADVLIYADGPGADPNENPYRGPVAQALNDYSISFYLTFTASYLNLSLMTESWTLVIIDNNYFAISGYVDEIINYVDTGGLLLIRSWQQRQVGLEPLCHYLGYDYNGTYTSAGPTAVHIWDSGHPVFNQPNNYGAPIINTTFNYFGTDFVHVDLFPNATSIAGITPTPQANVSAIILSANGRALSNTMALTQYLNDTDDSTYPDAVEIWQNEIAFMLRPHLAFTTNVPATVIQGTVLTFSVDVDNIVGRPALNGEMTVNVPAGLGTLTDPATQTFTSPLGPGSGDTITWHVTVTGLGDFTLGFTATFDGLPGTSYTTLPITADVEAIPLLILPGLPWWWWIVLIVIVVIVVIIIIILLMRRRGSKST